MLYIGYVRYIWYDTYTLELIHIQNIVCIGVLLNMVKIGKKSAVFM